MYCKNIIFPVLVGGFVKPNRALLYVYAPYWIEGQGGILKQKVCSTTLIKVKSYELGHGSKPKKKLLKGKKTLHTFCV